MRALATARLSWLAVCGPVLRDWWNLTLREAQCYDRWKTSSLKSAGWLLSKNKAARGELVAPCHSGGPATGVDYCQGADFDGLVVPASGSLPTWRSRGEVDFALQVDHHLGQGHRCYRSGSGSCARGAVTMPEPRRSMRRSLMARCCCVLVASLDAQASFRLAQSRLQMATDQQPIHQSIWRFSQCLLAEAETLSLMSSTPVVTASPIKVKQMEAPTKAPPFQSAGGDKGKGGSTSSSTAVAPCRHFRSDAGCKAGKSC